MSTITLIGTRLAEVGEEFVYEGEATACEDCPYRNQCLNLTEGVRYEVTDLREGAQTLDCGVHDDGVTAVEVEPTTVTANVNAANAYAGSKSSLEGPCPYVDCPSHEFCEPSGVEFGEERQIQTVVGDPPHETCYLDRNLTMVEFTPDE